MKILQSLTCMLFFLLLVGSMPSLAQTVSSSEANREVLKSLLEDLQNRIDKADDTGHMEVLIDGKKVLSTVELFYSYDFQGLALVNQGGTYEWGPIKILKALKATQP